MFSPIPYYKDGKIQKICIDSSGYIITRYKNEHEKYSSKLSLSDDNKLLLEQEYYDTIREFLEINKLKYELLKRKICNKINMKINNGLMLASVLSLFFSLVLIFSGSIYINLVGIILISISFLTFSYSYKNMKTNKANRINKEFCDDYDNLKRIFTNYLVIKNNKILGKTNISPVKRVNLLESGKIKKRKK